MAYSRRSKSLTWPISSAAFHVNSHLFRNICGRIMLNIMVSLPLCSISYINTHYFV